MTERKIYVDEPCNQKWDNFKALNKGKELHLHCRYCENCDKEVIDFTQKTKDEIIDYWSSNKTKDVCGRFLENQLDKVTQEFIIEINCKNLQLKKNSLIKKIVSISSLLLIFKSFGQNTKSPDSTHTNTYQCDKSYDSLMLFNKQLKSKSSTDLLGAVMGKISSISIMAESHGYDDHYFKKEGRRVYVTADQSPEYVGGFAALFDYMKTNFVYPKEEKKHKTEGTVYVSFIVNSSGLLSDFQIVKGCSESGLIEQEVIRTLKQMPLWKPALLNNKPVNYLYRIPVRIKL